MSNAQPVEWLQLRIICPGCGNRGAVAGPWLHNSAAPFRLIEYVVRAWPFAPKHGENGVVAAADASRDQIDWESGIDPRLECMQCLTQFPLPDGFFVEFE